MNRFSFIIVLIIISLSVSCTSDDGGGEEPPKQRTADDVREDFSNLTINDGVNDLVLESIVEGSFWNFRIEQPAGASASNKRPLILNLHGGARNVDPNFHKVSSCLLTPFDDLEPYILRPNSNGSHWYEEVNQLQILALIDLIKQFLPIDVDRIVIQGFSDGGNASFFYAQFYPNLFSAAIPMATSYDTEGDTGFHNFAIPIYAIHGEDDLLFSLATTQGYIDGSIAAGSDIEFVVAPGLGHMSGCQYETYMEDVKDWLVNDVWD